jgi:hypothetical protein
MARTKRNGKRRTTSRRGRNTIGEATGPIGHPNSGPMVPRKDYLLDNVAGVSQSIRRTLVFSVGGIFNFSSAVYSELAVVILNSAYVPCNALASGVSVDGYAKYMGFYSKCFVLGARAKVKLVNYLVTSVEPVLVGFSISTTAASLTGYQQAINSGLSDWDMLGANPDHRILNASVDVGKFLNKPTVLDDPQLFSIVNASPTQLIAAHFWISPLVAGGNIAFTIELEQDCVLTDPVPFT